MKGPKVRRESAPVPKRSEDFDLLIERAQGRRGTKKRYKVRLLHAPEGQTLPDSEHFFSERDLESLSGSIEVWRDLGPKTLARKTPEEVGAGLFHALISGEIRRQWDRSLTAVGARQSGLRLLLRLGSVPELEEWPWELLYDRTEGHFLALAQETSIVRYLENPTGTAPKKHTFPLKILVVVANPSDCDRIDGEGEWGRLKQALKRLVDDGKVRVERLSPPTLPAFERMMSQSWHIVHFVGHGRFDGNEGSLILEDDSGQRREVPGKTLKVLLESQRNLRLVVVNACVGAKTSPENVFAGVAQSLVRAGVPAVVAMRSQVSDRAALTFAGRFYEELAKNRPIDAALGETRRAMQADSKDLEWSTPVLYMRSVVEVIEPPRYWRQFLAAALSAVVLGVGGYWLSIVPNRSSDPSCPSPPGIDVSLVKIEPGRFFMGPKGRQVQVEITRPYCLGKFEVTQGQWKNIMGSLPHQAQDGDDLPVGNVSWNDAQLFLARLTAREPAAHFRLPSNAQWEYGARAGTSGLYSFGEEFSDLELYGNCRKAGHPTPVGHFLSNRWGLYDMYGNVSEWVGDWAGPPANAPSRDPVGPETGTEKIRRGGSFNYSRRCNSTFQVFSKPDRHNEDTGFRIVRDPVR